MGKSIAIYQEHDREVWNLRARQAVSNGYVRRATLLSVTITDPESGDLVGEWLNKSGRRGGWMTRHVWEGPHKRWAQLPLGL